MNRPTPPDSERESGHHYLLEKRGLYYRPDNQGYTGIKDLAGRYPQSGEDEDCGIKAIHEDDAPSFSAACWPELAQAHLEGQLTTLRQRADKLEAALRDVVNPLGVLQRNATAWNSASSAASAHIANDLCFVQNIAKAALEQDNG